jgi:GNAT superfamily N-acetyltransferase
MTNLPHRHERIAAGALAADAQFWDIYGGASPTARRESPTVILDSVRFGTGLALRTVADDGRTLAIATLHLLRSVPALFLVYLAVDATQRGAGLGGSLLDRLAALDLLPGCLGIVWETDRVDEAESEADRRRRDGQIRFFRYHGGRVVCTRYRQPTPNGELAVPMNLMFRPAGPEIYLGPDIAGVLTRAIYFEKYAAVNGISRLHLEDLLAGVTNPRPPWGGRPSDAAEPGCLAPS